MSRASRRPLSTFEDLVRVREEVRAVDDRVVHQVPIGKIRLSGRNPRRTLPALDEMGASLREHDLLQPVLVRKLADGYELIAGHRRLEAWKRLGRTEIAAKVIEGIDDDRAFVLMLVENLQRENLEPAEEADALVRLEQQLGSAQAVAGVLKRSEAYVSKRKRVYQDQVLAEAVLDRGLSVTTAEELLPVRDGELRQSLTEQALRERWDAPRARRVVKERNGMPTSRGFESKPGSARSRAVAHHVRELRRLIEAAPVSELEPGVADELRSLARDLNEQLTRLPL